jgi:hypothetical protein
LLRIPLLIGQTGVSGSWLFYAPDLDLYTTGTVDQLTAGIRAVDGLGAGNVERIWALGREPAAASAAGDAAKLED